MPVKRPTYTATFERAENGTWVVALAEEPNVHAYGETLLEARRNIRDAITTLFGPFGEVPSGEVPSGEVPSGVAEGFELLEEVRLPEAVLAMVRKAGLQARRAHQQRAEARAAEEAVVATTRQAMAVTRQAARLLAEHASLMNAQADDSGLVEDVRLPEAVLLMVERAHLERQTACRQRETARATQDAAAVTSGEALASNREAARLLIEQYGLTIEEAAALLGLSPQRAQRLLRG